METREAGSARVLRGVEATLAGGVEIAQRARRLALLTHSRTIDEFLPAMLSVARALGRRPGALRIVSLGPCDPEVARAVAEAGGELRVLAEDRELSLMVTDRAAVLHPPDEGPDGVLDVCALVVEDVALVARLELAFDGAWARARPWTSHSARAADRTLADTRRGM